MLPFRVAVHIGYHKTATTWFQYVALNGHPGLVPVPAYGTGRGVPLVTGDPFLREIIWVRDGDFDPTKARSVLEARARAVDPDCDGKTVVVSAERLSGHAASGGFDAVRIAERLHATVPEAKVFWMVRDQASSIRSEYAQIVRAGWTGTVRQTLDAAPPVKTVGFDLAYWEYDRLAAAYKDRFGPHAVHLIDYADLRRDPREALAELAGFLDVAPWDMPDADWTRTVGASDPPRVTAVRRRMNHFRRSELNPFPVMRLPSRLRERAVKLARRLPRGRPLFPADFEDWAADRFRESNERLAAEHGLHLRLPTAVDDDPGD